MRNEMKFSYSVYRYDKKTSDSKRIGTLYQSREDAEKVRDFFRDNDPEGIFTVSENNDWIEKTEPS